ncbi:MAG: hypothetical protein IJ168_07955 [Eubacterium sp.]|nr:hypothetical protein [Eubacterium sp.]
MNTTTVKYGRQTPDCRCSDCFGCQNGRCMVLVATIRDKQCPFFKTAGRLGHERQQSADKIEKQYGMSYKLYCETKGYKI